MPNDFLEKTLELMVYENQEEAVKRGFPSFYKFVKNQFVLPSGKIIDILTFEIVDNCLRCKIFELKKDCITLQSLYQVIGYGQEIALLTGLYFSKIEVDLFAVGNDFDGNYVYPLLSWGINIGVVIYDYKIDGVKFELLNKDFKCWPVERTIEAGGQIDENFTFCEKLKSLLNEPENR